MRFWKIMVRGFTGAHQSKKMNRTLENQSSHSNQKENIVSVERGWEYTDISGERSFDTPWHWDSVRISYRDADDAAQARVERRATMSQAEMKALIDGLAAVGWLQESKREYRESWSATYKRKKA
ncbi:MAG: hypothetical protein IPK19_11675 [Chloroflexi bacterium]|nr:hypothetical protein [Chloroflexota bacterium]